MWSILVDVLNPYEATMEMIRKEQEKEANNGSGK